jgi:hypothetical protein
MEGAGTKRVEVNSAGIEVLEEVVVNDDDDVVDVVVDDEVVDDVDVVGVEEVEVVEVVDVVDELVSMGCRRGGACCGRTPRGRRRDWRWLRHGWLVGDEKSVSTTLESDGNSGRFLFQGQSDSWQYFSGPQLRPVPNSDLR